MMKKPKKLASALKIRTLLTNVLCGVGTARIEKQPISPTSQILFPSQDFKLGIKLTSTGTMRAHLQNSISGVSEGHVAILRLVGVGYRASIESSAQTKQPTYDGQQFVNLKLGYAHPVEMPVPKGVKATVPQPTRILLEGCDKHTVTKFAAEIREWRKPEPYKGKGIFVNDEKIRMKAKKIK